MIAAFVCAIYPTLFGLRSAPRLSVLAYPHGGEIAGSAAGLFLASLILVFVTAARRRQFLVLSLQATFATATLFDWLCSYLGITNASPWPGTATVVLMLAVVVLGRIGAGSLAQGLYGQLANRSRPASRDVILRASLNAGSVLFQVPLILIYAHALSWQIAV